MMLSAEWKIKAIKLPYTQSIQTLAFFDTAYLSDHHGDETDLSSVGLGVRWNAKNHFSARADLAFPLNEIDQQGREPLLHISINTFW
jgi:hemolysin activation/secretion protein